MDSIFMNHLISTRADKILHERLRDFALNAVMANDSKYDLEGLRPLLKLDGVRRELKDVLPALRTVAADAVVSELINRLFAQPEQTALQLLRQWAQKEAKDALRTEAMRLLPD
jgi:hypothetical protein